MSFKGKQREEDEQMGSDYSGSDVDEEMGDEMDEQQQIDADLPGLPVQHVEATGKYKNAQKIFLDVEFRGSLEDFERGTAKTTWNCAAKDVKHFKLNMTDKDRHLAKDDQLAGHTKRCVPMGMRVVQQMNSLPCTGQIHNAKMLPSTVHGDGAALHRTPPCALTTVDLNIFSPTSLIAADMIEKSRMCTPEMVTDTVRVVEPVGKKSGYGTVVIKEDDGKQTLAYKTLVHNLRTTDKFAKEKLSKDQVRAILFPPAKAKTVEVTSNMANMLTRSLLKDVQDLLERCIDLEKDLTFHFSRSDGEKSFNSPNMLEGSLIGAVVDESNVSANNPLLTKVGTYYAKIEFTFMNL